MAISKKLAEKAWFPSLVFYNGQESWTLAEMGKIGDEKLNLMMERALESRENAYEPYSDYPVGASVLSVSGNIFSSSNAEVVIYSSTDHAESAAIKRALDAGEHKKSGRRFVQAVLVVHESAAGTEGSGPCGLCLQRMYEHCDNAVVIVADTKGEIQFYTSLRTLMPRPFTPSHLESSDS